MSKVNISVTSNGRTVTVDKEFFGDNPSAQINAFGANIVAEAAERTFTNRAKGALQSLLDATENGEQRHTDKEIRRLFNERVPAIPAKKRTTVDKIVLSYGDMSAGERAEAKARLEAIEKGN